MWERLRFGIDRIDDFASGLEDWPMRFVSRLSTDRSARAAEVKDEEPDQEGEKTAELFWLPCHNRAYYGVENELGNSEHTFPKGRNLAFTQR